MLRVGILEHQRRSLHRPGRAGEALYPVPSLSLVWNLTLVGKHLRWACIAIVKVDLQCTQYSDLSGGRVAMFCCHGRPGPSQRLYPQYGRDDKGGRMTLNAIDNGLDCPFNRTEQRSSDYRDSVAFLVYKKALPRCIELWPYHPDPIQHDEASCFHRRG